MPRCRACRPRWPCQEHDRPARKPVRRPQIRSAPPSVDRAVTPGDSAPAACRQRLRTRAPVRSAWTLLALPRRTVAEAAMLETFRIGGGSAGGAAIMVRPNGPCPDNVRQPECSLRRHGRLAHQRNLDVVLGPRGVLPVARCRPRSRARRCGRHAPSAPHAALPLASRTRMRLGVSIDCMSGGGSSARCRTPGGRSGPAAAGARQKRAGSGRFAPAPAGGGAPDSSCPRFTRTPATTRPASTAAA